MARGTFYTTVKLGPKQSLTPEGFLLCEEVAIARTGMMIYGPDETPLEPGPDGIVKIFREADDVFRAETIASAQGKPVVNDHPESDVVPDNWKELSHGIMMNVRRGIGASDDLLLADLLVTTPEGIKAVRDGKIEVSLGYDADYEEVGPGVGKQTDIIINHVALVEQGRCGVRCAIGDSQNPQRKDAAMAKKNRFKDALLRAFKAKDAAEVEEIAKEVQDEFPEPSGNSESDTHIHLHGVDDETPAESSFGRTTFSDDDIQQHMDQNAAEHAEMQTRISALENLVSQLMSGETGEGEVGDGAEMSNEQIEGALREEAPAGTGDEAVKARDSRYLADSFQDTVAMAEILVPGIKVPTFDSASVPAQTFKRICGFRRQVLDAAYSNPSTRLVISDLTGSKALDTKSMTCDAVRVLFRSAAQVQRVRNMSPRASVTDTSAAGAGKPLSLADLNRRNAEKYGQPK